MDERLKNAVKADLKGYLAGLKLPVSLLEYGLTMAQEKLFTNPKKFLDWELKEWRKIYSKIPEEYLLKINYFNKIIFIPQVIVLDNTVSCIKINNFKLEDTGKQFNISKDILDKTELGGKILKDYLIQKETFYNENNLRLVEIISSNLITLKVERNKYLDYIYTNLVLDYKKNKKDRTLRQDLHRNGVLENLNESKLANNFGINGIILTANNKIIVPKRSSRVAFRANEYIPSFSGTMSEIDLKNQTFTDIVQREAVEELGIDKNDIKEMEILGITRELIRGGQPELFVIAQVNLTENEIRNKWTMAKDKYESKNIDFFELGIDIKKIETLKEKNRFENKINEFLKKYGNEVSIPLITSIALINKYALKI